MGGKGTKDLGHLPLLFQALDHKQSSQTRLALNMGCWHHRQRINWMCHDADSGDLFLKGAFFYKSVMYVNETAVSVFPLFWGTVLENAA